jgi:hypothetical protein
MAAKRALDEHGEPIETAAQRGRQRYCLKRVREGATYVQVAGELSVSKARASQIAAKAYRLEQQELGKWRGWPSEGERNGLWRLKLIRGRVISV